jgi:serine/threonine-protein kinase
VLAQGGMGTVYAGIHPQIHKRVAIKVISTTFASSEELAARLLREAQVVNRIRHPSLVDIFAFGQLPGGRPYLVMELLEGEPLSARLGRGPLPLAELKAIFAQLLDALGAAHEAGVVHRDLKPENIFLCRGRGEPLVKILDFGLAKDQGSGTPPMTRTGIAMGTPTFMSPEQCRGKGVDHRSDLYAVGVILYEAVTGQPPFRAESVLDLLNQHLSEAPEPPGRRAAIPPALDALILKALEKPPERRFQSAQEMLAALQAVEPAPPRPDGPRPEPPPAAPPVSGVEQTALDAAAAGPAARRPWRAALVGAGLMIVILALGALLRPRPEVAPRPVADLAAPRDLRAPDARPVVDLLPPPDLSAPREEAAERPARPAGPRPVRRPVHGGLTVLTGRPDAEVWLDNRPQGKGARVVIPRLSPGRHRLSVGAPQFQDFHGDVYIRAGQEQVARVGLVRRGSGKRGRGR